ncbi:hypothetical protein ACP3V5_20615 [Vibrio maritimus]
MELKVDLDFYNQLRVAVHKEWDPIGVCSYSEEMGEYDGYLPKLYELLKDGSSEEEVFNYLWSVETEAMGLSGDKQITRNFSKLLLKLDE